MSGKTVAEAREALARVTHATYPETFAHRVEDLCRAIVTESLPAQPKAEAGEPSGEAPEPDFDGIRFECSARRGRGVSDANWALVKTNADAIVAMLKTTDAGTGAECVDAPAGTANAGPAPMPVHPSQEQPASSGPGKPSGGAPSDESLGKQLFAGAIEVNPGPEWEDLTQFQRARCINAAIALFEAGAASRDAEFRLYQGFVEWTWSQAPSGITLHDLTHRLEDLRRDLAALDAKEGGKAT